MLNASHTYYSTCVRVYELAGRCVLQLCVCINRKNPGRSSSDSINEDESGNSEWSYLQNTNKQQLQNGHAYEATWEIYLCVCVCLSSTNSCLSWDAAGKVRLAC